MSRSRRLAIVAIAVVAVAVGGFVVYDQILRGDSTAALTLPTAAPSTAASTPTSTTPTAGASSQPAASASTAGSTDGDLAGTWAIATGSQAGLPVREHLASPPAERDAVGRPDQATASITLETNGSPTPLTAGTITVDTTSIQSDESRRDNRLRNEGLETD